MEKYGLTFIRFSNEEIKTNMFSVVLSLESKIEELKRENFIRYYSKKCFYYL
ncbi:endonuclease domain-containing protein [Capnocytophaga endodontalis]|uniref:endonuclease domain-containing protein n=1 Tax=Capnocytophaga endodontalis TaxID=2708117 RepID=UPI001F26202C|nr:endonuclease domain-containing protein [Capnocytophaga endodontalis]